VKLTSLVWVGVGEFFPARFALKLEHLTTLAILHKHGLKRIHPRLYFLVCSLIRKRGETSCPLCLCVMDNACGVPPALSPGGTLILDSEMERKLALSFES